MIFEGFLVRLIKNPSRNRFNVILMGKKTRHNTAGIYIQNQIKIMSKPCHVCQDHIMYEKTLPELIYNPITAMWFSAMFTFQQDNTKR